jgi:hypothetical protein
MKVIIDCKLEIVKWNFFLYNIGLMPAENTPSKLIVLEEIQPPRPVLIPHGERHPFADRLFVPFFTPNHDILLRTDRPVEAQDFLDDNHSELAAQKIARWQEIYKSGNGYIRVGCADARPIFDEDYVWNQRSIAAGFPDKTLYALTYMSNVKAVVVDTHYGNAETGKRPTGCGGQDTKAQIRANHTSTENDGLLEMVDKNVHEDPIYNGIDQARKIINEIIDRGGRNGKVFVTTQDHHTGKLIPVAEFIIKNGVLHRDIPVEYVKLLQANSEQQLEEDYDPATIYRNGVPHLVADELSPEFVEYLEIQERKRIALMERHPDFTQRQDVQNPWALVINANKIPVQSRMPTLFGSIGDAYELDIPGLKSDRVVTVSNEAITAAVFQMKYAMKHTIKHKDNPEASFGRSKTLFIDTGSLHQSQLIAQRLMQEEWAKEWKALGGRIFLAETGKGGIMQRVEEYHPVLKAA